MPLPFWIFRISEESLLRRRLLSAAIPHESQHRRIKTENRSSDACRARLGCYGVKVVNERIPRQPGPAGSQATRGDTACACNCNEVKVGDLPEDPTAQFELRIIGESLRQRRGRQKFRW